AAVLAREFSELAPSLEPPGAPPREGVLARLQMNAEKLIRVRRVDEPAGTDPGAIVARAEAKAWRGDIAGAASELDSLPPDVRARGKPPSTRAAASPPMRSRGWASDGEAHTRAAGSVCSLPPCRGGVGRGVVVTARGASANSDPHPQPLPARGRGGDRVRGTRVG